METNQSDSSMALKDTEKTPFLWNISIVLLLTGLTYVYSTSVQNYSLTPKWLFLAVIFVVSLLLFRKQSFAWNFPMVIWGGFVLQYFLGCFNSYNQWDALIQGIPLLLAPLIVLSFFRAEEPKEVYRKFSLMLLIVLTPLVIYGLLQVFQLIASGTYSRKATYALQYAFGHKNQFTHYLTLVIPFYVLGIFTNDKKWIKVVFGVGIFLSYCLVSLLQTRSDLLVLYGLYPVVGLIMLIYRYVSGKRRKSMIWGIVAIGIICVALVLSPVGRNIPFIGTLLESGSGSGAERLTLWRSSLDLWKEAPLLGHGSGDWKIEILRNSSSLRGALHSDVYFQRAHNDFIQTGVQNGIIGVLFLVAFFVSSLWTLIRLNWSVRYKLPLIAGVLAFLAIANFSYPMERIELLLLLFVLLLPVSKEAKSRINKLTGITLIIVGAGTLLLVAKRFISEKKFVEYRTTKDITLLQELNRSFYTIDPTSIPIDWYEGNYFFERGNYQNALVKYNEAFSRNPYQVHVLNNLAGTHFALGDTIASHDFYMQSLKINDKFIETKMNYAAFCFNTRNVSQALDVLLSIDADNEPENFRAFVNAVLTRRIEEIYLSDEGAWNVSALESLVSDEGRLVSLFNECREHSTSLESILGNRSELKAAEPE